MSAYDKFITPNFNSAKHGEKADALSSHQSPAEHGLATDSMQGTSPFTVDAAMGVGLLALVTMLGVHLRRRLQPATVIAAVGDNVMEMQSEDSHKMSSSRVGWGQLSAQNTRPSTLCYATESEETEDATESPAASTPQVAVAVAGMETQEDLKSLAKLLNPTVGYWDPLSIGEESTSLWNYNNERKIAWFRQAEIKHGRVAMAAFVGYCVQANGFRWTFPMTLSGADWPTGTPPEQWDALPSASKWQIITFVALLELFDESSKPHYTRGRRPGEFPTFKGTYIQERGLTPLDLFDPFEFSKNASPERKARGLRAEINNGRLAMLAVFAFMSASKAPGSVPLLNGVIPPYSGDYMVPFQGNFSLFSATNEFVAQNAI